MGELSIGMFPSFVNGVPGQSLKQRHPQVGYTQSMQELAFCEAGFGILCYYGW
jgi:hypothetical protein